MPVRAVPAAAGCTSITIPCPGGMTLSTPGTFCFSFPPGAPDPATVVIVSGGGGGGGGSVDQAGGGGGGAGLKQTLTLRRLPGIYRVTIGPVADASPGQPGVVGASVSILLPSNSASATILGGGGGGLGAHSVGGVAGANAPSPLIINNPAVMPAPIVVGPTQTSTIPAQPGTGGVAAVGGTGANGPASESGGTPPGTNGPTPGSGGGGGNPGMPGGSGGIATFQFMC